MNVPFDDWGELQTMGREVAPGVWEKDEIRYNQVEAERPITKKEIMGAIDAWRGDDGNLVDDVAIYISYENGDFVSLADVEGGKYKKRGVVGVSISTPDYEAVWGGDVNKRTGKIDMWETHRMDDEGNVIDGHTNVWSGYRDVSKYIVRTRTDYANSWQSRDGHKHPTISTVRRSKTVPTTGWEAEWGGF